MIIFIIYYYRNTLGKYIQEICENPLEGDASFEVDPKYLTGIENIELQLEKNRSKLRATCSKFLRRIFDSLEDTPLYKIYFLKKKIIFSLENFVKFVIHYKKKW